MPNHIAYSMLSGGNRSLPGGFLRVDPTKIDVPGTQAAPTYRGKVLHYPLYANANRFAYYPRSHTGLGFIPSGVFSVSSSIMSGAQAFLGALGSVISTVVNVITKIIDFIVTHVVAVVQSVLGAVGGLVGAVFDAISLKKGGDLKPSSALELASLLSGKHSSLRGADQSTKLDRPMTAEEKAAFERNMKNSATGINELAGKVITAVGGTGNMLVLGAAAAAAILLVR